MDMTSPYTEQMSVANSIMSAKITCAYLEIFEKDCPKILKIGTYKIITEVFPVRLFDAVSKRCRWNDSENRSGKAALLHH